MKYSVQLTTTAYVTATVAVEAATPEEAERKAIDLGYSGYTEWKYDGTDAGNSGVSVGRIMPIE